MIVVGHDEAETASTHTLVTAESRKIPPHFMKLICASFLVALLCLIFVLLDLAFQDPTHAVATILAFIFLLPYSGAALLLQWLQHHQTESILPFTPSSPRAIAYNIVIILLWAASTTLAAMRLSRLRSGDHIAYCYGPDLAAPGRPCGIYPEPSIQEVWPTLASTVASTTELVLVTAIALVCWVHQQQTKAVAPAEPAATTPSPAAAAKVISA